MTLNPYYQDDHVTLYNGNCREITEWLTADVLVTDPPYGMSFRSNFRADRFDAIAGDDDPAVRDEVLEMWGERPAAVFGTWRVPRPTSTRQVLIWHKRPEWETWQQLSAHHTKTSIFLGAGSAPPNAAVRSSSPTDHPAPKPPESVTPRLNPSDSWK